MRELPLTSPQHPNPKTQSDRIRSNLDLNTGKDALPLFVESLDQRYFGRRELLRQFLDLNSFRVKGVHLLEHTELDRSGLLKINRLLPNLGNFQEYGQQQNEPLDVNHSGISKEGRETFLRGSSKHGACQKSR